MSTLDIDDWKLEAQVVVKLYRKNSMFVSLLIFSCRNRIANVIVFLLSLSDTAFQQPFRQDVISSSDYNTVLQRSTKMFLSLPSDRYLDGSLAILHLAHNITGVLRAQWSTVPAAPPIRLPIPNPNSNPNPKTHPNPNPIFNPSPNPKNKRK